jgi:hypothetical protein
MKKLFLIFVFFFFILNPAHAEDINLLCDISYQDDDAIRPKTTRIKTRVEVSFFTDGRLFIIPDSELIGSVSTSNLPFTTRIINFSNLAKWHLINETYNPEKRTTSSTSIVIDRNAGTISYSRLFSMNNISIQATGFGNCEKINPNIKKF